MFLSLSLFLTSFSLFSSVMHVPTENLFAPQRLGTVSITHKNNEFYVNSQEVSRANMDAKLRGMSVKQLSAFLSKGYIAVNKNSANEYGLQSQPRLNGGGVWGAWLGATVGYTGVTFLGHGAIELVAWFSGPFYVPVSGTLHKACSPAIHSAALSAGVAGGIAGGVATGPV